jgi:regulator of cell morphogenesis and NO signaling
MTPPSPARAAAALDPQQPIGRIAVALPGATAVFRRLKLDYCCGGDATLAEAVAARRLDLPAVIDELRRLQRDDAPLPQDVDAAGLIEHILTRYHAVHRAQLPELIRMARRVEAVHAQHPQVPSGLADQLEDMQADLLQHMEKEEVILFPMLRDGGNDFAVQPIAMMRHEHVSHGLALEQLEHLAHGFAPPGDACNTWRALYGGLAQLKSDLIEHIHLENNLLFPAFEAAGR